MAAVVESSSILAVGMHIAVANMPCSNLLAADLLDGDLLHLVAVFKCQALSLQAPHAEA